MTASRLLFAIFDQQDQHFRIKYLSDGWKGLLPDRLLERDLRIEDLLEPVAHQEAHKLLENAIQRRDEVLTLHAHLLHLNDATNALLQYNLIYSESNNQQRIEGILRVDPYPGMVGHVLLNDIFNHTVKQICRRIGVAVALYNPKSGTFQFMNERFKEWVDQPLDPIVGKDMIEQSIHPSDRANLFNVLDSIQEYDAITLQIRTVNTSGQIQTIMADVQSFLKPHKSDEILALIAFQNITYFTKQQEMLEAQQSSVERKAREKMEYFSFLNHEMRNHLNVIQGVAKLLELQPHSAAQDKFIRSLSFSSQSLISLVNDVLDYAKISSGNVELSKVSFNLKELVENTCELYQQQAESRGLSFQLTMGTNVPDFLRSDPLRINQILTNLLSNAVKFTTEGSISVAMNLLKAERGDYSIQFIVEDTGRGIPQENLEDIFHAFRQVPGKGAKDKGSGLGLSIVRGLVNVLGGSIEVESELGVYSRFTLVIPMQRAFKKRHENTKWFEVANDSLEDMHVLYVEDQMTSQLIMEGYCEPWGIQLDTADTGVQAINKIKYSPYHAILLDMHLPDMSGEEVIRQAKEELIDSKQNMPPVIALSGEYDDGQLTALLQLGVRHHLLKPLEPEQLKSVLLQYRTVTLTGQEEKNDVISIPNESSLMDKELYPIDFSFLETTFKDQPDRLMKLLQLMQKEFSSSKMLMFEALAEKETGQFRDVKHKLLPSLNYLQMAPMRDLLEEIKADILANEEAFDFDNYKDKLDHFYTSIQVGIKNKLTSLAEV